MSSIAREILTEGAFSGIFPGWGASRIVALNYENSNNVQILADSSVNASKEENPNKHRKEAKLNTLFSISIAGCDLMGSALYTAGTCAANSGKLAPVGLFLVTSMLFLFRKVYSEVVTAIPVNGGTYNLMLNTTTKKMAGFVACLSILSYTATAILSAFDAVVYMAELWETVDVRLFSVLILLFFGVVTICGVKESAQVTSAMFLVHMFALTLLILWGFAHGCQDNFSLFSENLRTPVPTIYDSSNNLLARRNPAAAIFFGYSSGLLGITGFETASNYVEDLADTSVFVSTVNWMWILVGIYNPLLSLMSMMVLPMQTIYDHPSDMLAEMAGELGGYGFKAFLCADAIFILCGGVLTALVGVSGLLGRLAKDRVLPEVFGYTNAGGSYYIAITIFVIVAVTLFLAIYDPEDPTAINNFGGVFAISFLSVLTAFGCGAVLLKLYRPRIARLVIANWWQIIVSTLAVFAGLIGNIVLTPSVFYLFLAYLAGFLAVVTYMFLRVEILTFGIWMIRKVCMSTEKKQKEAKKEENIVQACLTQYQYDEDQQVQQVVVNRKELKAAAKKSIFLQQTRSVLCEKQEEVNIEMISIKSDAIESPNSRSLLPNRADAGSGGFFSFASPTKKRTNSAEESEIAGKKENKTSGTPHHHSLSALDLIEFVQKRMSSLQIYSPVRYFDRNSSQSLDEIQMLLQRPILGKYLQYLMTSLDDLVSVPFVYLAKNSDPISLLLAVNYIDNNELSNNIYILHFVDDRKAITAYREYEAEVAEHTRTTSTDSSPPSKENGSNAPNHGFLLNMFMKPGSDASSAPSLTVAKDAFTLNAALPTLPHDTQQLLHNVAVLDAFYTYKKIHTVVIRGGFFSPACLDCVADYLGLRKNNMIMGVPDQKFPFPFAKLGGCRIAIPDADSNVRQQASSHLRTVFNTIHSHSPDLHHTESKLGTDDETKSDIYSDVYSNPLVKEDSRPLFEQQQLDV